MSNVSLVEIVRDARQNPDPDSYAWATTKTILLGDFYDDPTWLGLGVRAGLGCVPVLGQVLDLADTAAWVVLAYERGIDDSEVMLNGAILFIGYVPGVGDLMRSVLKGLVSNRAVKSAGQLLELALNSVSKNQYKALKEAVQAGWDSHLDEAIAIAKKFLDKFSELLAELKSHLPKRLTGDVDKFAGFITELRGTVDAGFRKALQKPREQLDKLFAEFEELRVPAGAKGTAARVDGVVPPNKTDGIAVRSQADEAAEAAEIAETTLRNRGTIPSEQWRDGVAKLEQPGDYFVISNKSGGKEGLVEALKDQPVEYAVRRRAGTGEWYVIRGGEGWCPHLDNADVLIFHNHPPGSWGGAAPSGVEGDLGNIEQSRDLRGKAGTRSTIIGNEEGTHRWSFRRREDAGDDMSLIGGNSAESLTVRARREAALKEYGYIPGEKLEVVGYDRLTGQEPIYEGGVFWDGKPTVDSWEGKKDGKIHWPDEEPAVLPPKLDKDAKAVADVGSLTPSGQAFKAKFGDEGVVAYRGIRLRRGGEVQQGWKNPGNEGQMVILPAETIADPADVAKHYAKQAPGANASTFCDDDDIVVMSFRVRPGDVHADPYDTLEHVILKPDVDLTSLPDYKEVRHSLQPPDTKGIPIVDPDYRTPTVKAGPSHPQGADAPSKPNTTGEPVDLVSGAVLAQEQDFALPGPLPLTFSRSWSSTHARRVGPLGRGWTHSLDQSLLLERDRAVLRIGGRSLYFAPLDSVGQSDYNRGARLQLTRRERGYTVCGPDHVTYAFGEVGRFDGALALAGMVDRNGNRIVLEYDESGLLVEVIDSAGRQLRFINNEDGFLTAVEAPAPQGANGEKQRIVSYTYDEEPHLIGVDDALDNTFSYYYDDEHLIVQHIDRNGLSFNWEYETGGLWPRCVKTWGEGNVLSRELAYDRPHRITTVRDSAGQTWIYHGNTIGMVAREIDPLGNETRREYDEDGNLLAETDPAGHTTRTEYDTWGRPVAEIDALGGRSEVRYDISGRVRATIDAAGQRWTYTHDEAGNVSEAIDPQGGHWRYRHDDRGQPLEVTDPAGHRMSFEWDAAGNPASSTDREGGRTRMTFDGWGRILTREDAEGNTTRWSWDLAGRLASQTDAAGRMSTFTYDGEGNQIEAVGPLGQQLRYTVGPLGKVLRTVRPNGQTTHLKYDRELRLEAIKDARGKRWLFERDPLGRVTSETTFDGRRRQYSYDPAGRLTFEQDAQGRSKQLAYDAAGHLLERTYADGRSERFEYDALGRMCLAQNEAGTLQLRYDALGNVCEETFNGETVTARYDRCGNRICRTSPLGNELRFAYDAERRLVAVHQGQEPLMFFDRDALGREVSRRLMGGLSMTHDYLPTGELARTRTARDATTLSARDYHYDPAGRLAKVTDRAFGAVTFEHDLAGRLEQAIYPDDTAQRFLADPAGNVPGVPDVPSDALPAGCTESNGWRLRWGADGSLLEKEGRELHYSFAYDSAGRLMQVTRDVRVSASKHTKRRQADPSGRQVTSFAYDALGRRVSKRRQAGSGEVEQITFLWDGNVPLGHRRQSSGGVSETIEYVFDEGFAPLAQLGGQQDCVVECDQLATPRAAYDTRGEVIWQADYSAFGVLREERGQQGLIPFRFPGQYADDDIGLHYNRFRYYDPELRMYTSADPFGVRAGENDHNYVDDPLSYIDPYGLSCMAAGKNFDQARREAFENAGMTDPSQVKISKVDEASGTAVEFKGAGGAKVGYDSPHVSPGPHHDVQHISWQSAGKRGTGGTKRGNIPYDGPQHPFRR